MRKKNEQKAIITYGSYMTKLRIHQSDSEEPKNHCHGTVTWHHCNVAITVDQRRTVRSYPTTFWVARRTNYYTRTLASPFVHSTMSRSVVLSLVLSYIFQVYEC